LCDVFAAEASASGCHALRAATMVSPAFDLRLSRFTGCSRRHNDLVQAFCDQVRSATGEKTDVRRPVWRSRINTGDVQRPVGYIVRRPRRCDCPRAHTANYKRVEAQHPQDLERLQLKDLLIDPNAGDDYAPPGETLTLAAVCVEHNNLHMSQLRCTPLNQGQQLPRASDLFLALGNGLHEALTAMAQALADHAGMTAQELLGVLSAKDPEGTPGLHMAMQEGHADTLRVFSGILQSAELPIDDKARLLATRDAAGTPGLSVAMEVDGHAIWACRHRQGLRQRDPIA
jgi:hypothetical protein